MDRDHPIARGLDAAFLANDELYHRMDHKPNIRVIASAFSDPQRGGTGDMEPVMWTLPFGSGRGVHLTLGHDLSAISQPGFAAAFVRGVEWAATGAVVPQQPAGEQGPRVLVVTGGHSYPTDFYTLFDGMRWSHAAAAEEAFRPGMQDRADVLVLHDMREEIAEPHRAALRAFIESGRGVVSIHHAVVDYTSWPWWYREVTGGKYFTAPAAGHPKSAYREGVDFIAEAVKGAAHPVLRGVPPLALHDEVYRGMWHSPEITVLMQTDHPENDRPVVYLGPHPKIRAVTIQPGHEPATFRHPGYRRLVANAIRWAAGTE
jgi:type 1 glutamine amidotransferase